MGRDREEVITDLAEATLDPPVHYRRLEAALRAFFDAAVEEALTQMKEHLNDRNGGY